MYLSRTQIEEIAVAVMKDFNDYFFNEKTGRKKEDLQGTPIDQLAKDYLGLSVSFAHLSSDGNLCGLTAYADTEFVLEENGQSKTIFLKQNQVILDMSFIAQGQVRNLCGKRRFTLAHECAHQILYQMQSEEVKASCRKKYAAHLPAGTKEVAEMAPTKSNDRVLPLTEQTRTYFEQQLAIQQRRKELTAASGAPYYNNDLVVAKPDGAPFRRDAVSTAFGQLIRHLEMPHLRFHDLRHTAATNMHQLTGDFYTVGEILGHTLKGIGMSLGISTNFDAVTAQYVDVRLDRKKTVLETYHKALHPAKEPEKPAKAPKQSKKKSSEMEL